MAIGLGKGFRVASVNETLATRSRATFAYRINFKTIGFNNKDPMNEWCEQRCQGLWKSETFFAIYWQFELESDAIMFYLRWATSDGNVIK